MQSRGREGRERVSSDLPAIDVGDGECRRPKDCVGRSACLGLGVEIEAVEALAVEVSQPRGKGLTGFRLELDLDGPVFAGLERLDFGFPLADQAQGYRLDTARRTAAWKLAPQHRRQCETDEIIQRPAGEIRFDELAVDLAGPAERFEHRVLGHFVEDDPFDVEMLEPSAGTEHLADMPGDRLAFAVGVSSEEEVVGVAHRLKDCLHMLFGFAVDLP